MACLGLGNKVGQRQVGIGAGHQVYAVLLEQFLLHALRHTAQHTDDEGTGCRFTAFTLEPFLLQRIQRLQPVIDLLLRIIAHRAGVQQHGVGLVDCLRRLIARHLHDRGHYL